MRVGTAVFVAVAVVLFVGLAPAAAADKPKDLVIGKWEPEAMAGKGFSVEFMKTGALKITAKDGDKDVAIDGTYKFLSDDSLEISLEFMGEKKTEKITIKKIDKNEMTTVDEKQKEEKFKRIK